MDPVVRHATTADGVAIAYAVAGPSDGPSLVHLPGMPFSNLVEEWRIPTLRLAFDELTRGLRFVQYDGRGTGRSQRHVAELGLGLPAMLRDLDAVIDAERLDRVVLLGFYHSVTAAIAWAARHPQRVRGMVLFGGAARGWAPMSAPGTQALLSLIEHDWDTFVESIAHAWLGWPEGEDGRLAAEWFRTATTPAIARSTLTAAAEIDVTADLGSVTCPVLVLHRADATVIPLALSEELATGIPDARLEILPGNSASLFFEDGVALARRIAEFVRKPTTADPGTAVSVARVADEAADRAGLTAREVEVLLHIAAGDSNGEIAAALGISINTVERHVSTIYRKLDVRGRSEATAWAIRRGLA